MWNSYSTDGLVGVTAEITTFAGGGGDEIHAYVASPVAGSPRPGIVLVHHMPGWDEFYFECAERLARHGYDVICPDGRTVAGPVRERGPEPEPGAGGLA